MASQKSVKGEMACLKFELRAYEKGGVVSKPTVEVEYDRILDLDGRLYKVQVRWADHYASNTDGAVQCHLRRIGRGGEYVKSFKPSEVDAVVFYLPSIDKLVWLSKEHFEGKSAINMRVAPPKKKDRRCFLVEDFVW